MDDSRILRALALDDSYRVERVLAEGPTGRTELVTLDGEGPLVRKRIPLRLANPRAWASIVGIEDPLIPQVENIYQMPDELVVIYAYVEGEPLRSLVRHEGRLDASHAVDILTDVCHAASVLHEAGVVHRDITPGNVICAQDGAHLVDLGIARVGDPDAAHDTTTLGTWGFIAPEQLGYAQTDARSDVFSLGRLLGYMLTGTEPGEPGYEVLLSDVGHVPPHLRDVIDRACALEPSGRYQSACDMANALRIVQPPATSVEQPQGQAATGRGASGEPDRRTLAGQKGSDAGASFVFSLDEVAPEGDAGRSPIPGGTGEPVDSTSPATLGFSLREGAHEATAQLARPGGDPDAAGQRGPFAQGQQSASAEERHVGRRHETPSQDKTSPVAWIAIASEHFARWAKLPLSAHVVDLFMWCNVLFLESVFLANDPGNRQGSELIAFLAMDAWSAVWTIAGAVQGHWHIVREGRFRWGPALRGLARWFAILVVGIFLISFVQTFFFPGAKG